MLAALEAGTLVMRTLDGPRPANLNGAPPELVRAVADARAATDDFARWVAARASSRTGPVGRGQSQLQLVRPPCHARAL